MAPQAIRASHIPDIPLSSTLFPPLQTSPVHICTTQMDSSSYAPVNHFRYNAHDFCVVHDSPGASRNCKGQNHEPDLSEVKKGGRLLSLMLSINSLCCGLAATIGSAAAAGGSQSGHRFCFAQNILNDLSCPALSLTADSTCEITSNILLGSS